MKIALVGTSILPLVATAISMLFLPDTIAFHFDANGEPDAWEQKPMLFLSASMVTVCLLVLVGSYLLEKKQKETGVEYLTINRPMPLWLCWVFLVVFNVINAIPLLYNAGIIGVFGIGPAMTFLFPILSIVLFVFGVQFYRGKWLSRTIRDIEENRDVEVDDYWRRVGKVIGVFFIIIAVIFMVLVISINRG